MQVHRPRPAVGVIGVDVADPVGGEIHQCHDMAAGAERRAAQADGCPQIFVDGKVENAAAAVARILNAIAHACFQKGFFQAAGTARTGMAVGEAVNCFDAVVAGQRLQSAPAAAAGRPILDAALRRNVDRRPCR